MPASVVGATGHPPLAHSGNDKADPQLEALTRQRSIQREIDLGLKMIIINFLGRTRLAFGGVISTFSGLGRVALLVLAHLGVLFFTKIAKTYYLVYTKLLLEDTETCNKN